MTTSLLSELELSALKEVATELEDAKSLLKQTTDASDRQQLVVMIDELNEQMTAAVHEIALAKKGIQPAAAPASAKSGNVPATATATAVTSAPAPTLQPAHHLMRWDDGKLYACDVTSLFFEGDDIRCTVNIPGYPANKRKNNGRGEIVSLTQNIVGVWDATIAFAPPAPTAASSSSNATSSAPPPPPLVVAVDSSATTTAIAAGSKCFAVDLASTTLPDEQVFVVAVVERLTLHATVWVQRVPQQQQQQQQASAAPTASFEVPLSYVRPYCIPPYQGKILRRKWENMTREEQHEIIEEKKRKSQEQQEAKRRQRSETINQQANNWHKMKAMMGGRQF